MVQRDGTPGTMVPHGRFLLLRLFCSYVSVFYVWIVGERDASPSYRVRGVTCLLLLITQPP